ncbi:SDR family oxidoreductase [Vibrio fluvialis]|nr:SDR family oxidoreductase [Vibrio fluvialis]
MKILLTGYGDLATAIAEHYSGVHEIYLPSREELDVTSTESVRKFFENICPDIVVNLAGTLYSSSIINSDEELWIRDINVNLVGTYLINKFALRKNKHIKLINISSTAAYNSYFDWTSYCASKAGVIKISNGLAIEGYDVVTLCPGAIDTKIRNGLKIKNPNVMDVQDGIKPIIDAIEGKYSFGDIVLYRKNELEVKREI